jgi:nucleotide-binding universal stress UspA family protein
MYREILLALDLNEESSWRKALPTAMELARTFKAGLHVMTVVPTFGMSIVAQNFPAGFEKKALAEAKRRLDDLVAAEIPTDLKAQQIVSHGTVYKEIIDAAKAIKVDLIVLASHRPELRDYLLGPNAARVVRHFPGSVLVVRE